MAIISIDHGNRQVKTKNKIFVSGITESDTPPTFGKDILKYKGKYYSLSNKRISYERNKSNDERFYILTLFAIAYELEVAKVDFNNRIIDIQLAVGLPPAHFGALSEKFEKNFLRNTIEIFEFHGKTYKICINKVMVFPQTYAATIPIRNEIINYPKAFIIDIGGFTLDYLIMRYGEMDSQFGSLENGVFFLYNPIIERVNSSFDMLLEENDIDDILLGRRSDFPQEVVAIVKTEANTFVNDFLSKLRERSIDLRTGRTVFVGGGAILLRKFIEKSDKINNPIFVNEISANANGFEILYYHFNQLKEGI